MQMDTSEKWISQKICHQESICTVLYKYLSITVSLHFGLCLSNIREAEEKQAINIISTKGQRKEKAIKLFQHIQGHFFKGEDAVKLEGSPGGLVPWASHTKQLKKTNIPNFQREILSCGR